MQEKDYKKIIKKIDKYISERKFWSSFDDEVEELREDIRKAKKYDKRNPAGVENKIYYAVNIMPVKKDTGELLRYYIAFNNRDMELLNDYLFEIAHAKQLGLILDTGADHGLFGMNTSPYLLAANMMDDVKLLLPKENGFATYKHVCTPVANLLMAILYDDSEFSQKAIEQAQKEMTKKIAVYDCLHIDCMLAILQKDYNHFNEVINNYCEAYKKSRDFFQGALAKQFVIEAHGMYNLARYAFNGEMKEKIELPKADNFCQELAIWQNEHNNVVGKIHHIYPEDLDFYNRFMMSKPVKMHLITIPKEKETIVHKGTITDNDRYLKDLISENEWHNDL